MLLLESKFDDQGRQTEALYLKKGETVLHRLVKEYDDEANTKTRRTYDTDGQQKPGRIVNKYDENKNLIKQDWYDSPDRIHLTFDYTYSGGRRQTKTRSALGKILEVEKYKHDKKGNIKEIHTYEPDKESGELKLSEIRIDNYSY